MRLKNISAIRVVVTLLAAVGSYAVFSFLAACLCLWEIASGEKMSFLYFSIGLLGTLFTALITKQTLKEEKKWTVLIALVLMLLTAFLCGGKETAAARAWIYPGCGAGAVLALMGGYKKRNRRGHEKRRRKKRSG